MEKTYIYQEIAESLRRSIAEGKVQPGDKLPPVREMARRWDCTPGTVSRAYSQLAQDGLVVAHRGSGTRVTPNPLQPERPTWGWANLINRAESFLLEAISGGHTAAQAETALAMAVARWQELQEQGVPQAAAPPAGPAMRLRFAGSHDLTISILARMLGEGDRHSTASAGHLDEEEASHAQLEVEYVGSLGGLMALARNEADVAGAHLWDETSDTFNLPFVRRLLPGKRVALLTVAHRSLGLIVPPGNPRGVEGLVDLARSDLRLVNRQSGSGTRVWLDAHLKALEITPQEIPGYERQELTHLAVARAVESGEADVGLGIHAAAAVYGLGFVSLTQERYDLVLLEAVWRTPAAQALVAIVRSDAFKEAVAALGGYDTAETGKETWVS